MSREDDFKNFIKSLTIGSNGEIITKDGRVIGELYLPNIENTIIDSDGSMIAPNGDIIGKLYMPPMTRLEN